MLKVWPNSPGHIAGLEPFFDFIIGVNEFRLDIDGDQLKQVTAKNVDKEVKLTVYNSKNQDVRELTMIPTNTWGGKGLLGLSIRYCSFEGASENVWHILNVAPNSPASAAGLQSNLDYIIAADSLPLDERDDLFGLIESHNNSQLKLFPLQLQHFKTLLHDLKQINNLLLLTLNRFRVIQIKHFFDLSQCKADAFPS